MTVLLEKFDGTLPPTLAILSTMLLVVAVISFVACLIPDLGFFYQLKLSPGHVHGCVHQIVLKSYSGDLTELWDSNRSQTVFCHIPVSTVIFQRFVQMVREIIITIRHFSF